MENQQQLVAYIQYYLQSGYAESSIRAHLLQYGWNEAALDEAFKDAHATAGGASGEPASPHHKEGDKSFVGTWLLSYFFGFLGVDRMYLGLIGTGILKLLTFGGLGIWAFIDVIRIGFGIQKDKKKRVLKGYYQNKQAMKIVTIVVIIIHVLSLFFVAMMMVFIFASIPSLQQDGRNTARQKDVEKVMAGIAQYATGHEGDLPESAAPGEFHTLYLCADGCTSQDKEVLSLGFYNPTNVVIAPYIKGLGVPDATKLYVVNNATCNASQTGLGEQLGQDDVYASSAVLYAIESSSGVEQRCVAVRGSVQ